MKALILVDIQNDFTPGGALAVSNGNEVIPIANNLMPNYDLVVATQDWHPSDHLSFASQHDGARIGDMIELAGLPQILWPDHCIQNSNGAALCDGLDMAKIDQIVHKGTDRNIDSYSGFFNNGPPETRRSTGLTELLQDRSIKEVHIMGLATNYCVKFTALDAVASGLDTYVIKDGIRGVELNPGDCAEAIKAMRKAGVKIIEPARSKERERLI